MIANKPGLKTLEHPLAAVKLSILRAKTTPPDEFRRALQQLSVLLLVEASRGWETAPVEIETPLARCDGQIARRPLVLVPILRAGLGMLDGMLAFLPNALVGHIGVYRNESTLEPVTYYKRVPPQLSEAQVVLIDPMLATGNSACAAIDLLKKDGATRIQFVSLVACTAGVERLRQAHEDVPLITAAVDPELNGSGYIVPGLGDAGDRYFGTS